MTELIGKYIDISREFSERTGQPYYDVPMWTMFATGGMWHVRPTNRDGSPQERHARGEDPAPFTDDQVHDWLLFLVEQVHLEEDFLVLGLVRFMEVRLESMLEDSARGTKRAQSIIDWLGDLAANPDDAAVVLAQLNEMRPAGSPPATLDEIPEVIKGFEPLAAPRTVEQLRQRQQELNVWRELTATLHLEDG